STPHLAGELLKQMAGIEMTHVPYRGASPALNDLIPGRVDCYFGSGALLENMRSGQLRGLAVTGAKRDPVAPELPTMAEAGVPGYEERRNCPRWPRPAFRVTRCRRGTACSCRPGRRLKSSGK